MNWCVCLTARCANMVLLGTGFDPKIIKCKWKFLKELKCKADAFKVVLFRLQFGSSVLTLSLSFSLFFLLLLGGNRLKCVYPAGITRSANGGRAMHTNRLHSYLIIMKWNNAHFPLKCTNTQIARRRGSVSCSCFYSYGLAKCTDKMGKAKQLITTNKFYFNLKIFVFCPVRVHVLV